MNKRIQFFLISKITIFTAIAYSGVIAYVFTSISLRLHLVQSHSKLIAAAPLAAQRLIDVINDESNRGYVVVQAVESLFRIIDRGITDRENAENIKQIKESLNALERGSVIDI